MLANRDRAHKHAQNSSVFYLNDNEIEMILPTMSEILYLRRGLDQPGGKLPLFDLDGQEVDPATVRRCLAKGWAEPWFQNPIKPDWLVCKLTATGKRLASQ